ncbi:hypothetical protein [Gemmiger formicilis]
MQFFDSLDRKSGGADKDLVLAKAVKMQDNREAGGLRLPAGPKGR